MSLLREGVENGIVQDLFIRNVRVGNQRHYQEVGKKGYIEWLRICIHNTYLNKVEKQRKQALNYRL